MTQNIRHTRPLKLSLRPGNGEEIRGSYPDLRGAFRTVRFAILVRQKTPFADRLLAETSPM